MQKRYLILSAIIGIALLGTGSVLAWGGSCFGNLLPEEIAGRQQAIFEQKAQALGISVDEMKNYWAEGKSMREIIEEKGIDWDQFQAKMRETQLERMRNHIQILVDKGVITQEQADKRFGVMENRTKNNRMEKMGKMGRGFKGFGFEQ